MARELFRQLWDTTRPAWANPSARWRVLFVMGALAEEEGELIETVARIGELAGVSERQTQRHIADLRAEGWVTIIEPGRGQGRPNVYRVTTPEGWEPARAGAWWEEPAPAKQHGGSAVG